MLRKLFNKNDYGILDCDLDTANCAEIVHAITEYGDGDMKQGVKSVMDDKYDQGKLDGELGGSVVSAAATVAICVAVKKIKDWYDIRQIQKLKEAQLHEAFVNAKENPEIPVTENNNDEDINDFEKETSEE